MDNHVIEIEVTSVLDKKVEEKLTRELDFSSGNQVITPEEIGETISKVTIIKPDTFAANNIKANTNIGGVIGTFSNYGSEGAVASDIKAGTKAAVNGEDVEGSMPEFDEDIDDITQNGHYSFGTSGKYVPEDIEFNVNIPGVELKNYETERDLCFKTGFTRGEFAVKTNKYTEELYRFVCTGNAMTKALEYKIDEGVYLVITRDNGNYIYLNTIRVDGTGFTSIQAPTRLSTNGTNILGILRIDNKHLILVLSNTAYTFMYKISISDSYAITSSALTLFNYPLGNVIKLSDNKILGQNNTTNTTGYIITFNSDFTTYTYTTVTLTNASSFTTYLINNDTLINISTDNYTISGALYKINNDDTITYLAKNNIYTTSSSQYFRNCKGVFKYDDNKYVCFVSYNTNYYYMSYFKFSINSDNTFNLLDSKYDSSVSGYYNATQMVYQIDNTHYIRVVAPQVSNYGTVVNLVTYDIQNKTSSILTSRSNLSYGSYYDINLPLDYNDELDKNNLFMICQSCDPAGQSSGARYQYQNVWYVRGVLVKPTEETKNTLVGVIAENKNMNELCEVYVPKIPVLMMAPARGRDRRLIEIEERFGHSLPENVTYEMLQSGEYIFDGDECIPNPNYERTSDE